MARQRPREGRCQGADQKLSPPHSNHLVCSAQRVTGVPECSPCRTETVRLSWPRVEGSDLSSLRTPPAKSNRLQGRTDYRSERKGQVRKGEQGTLVVFFKDFPPHAEDSSGNVGVRFVARASTVFNAEQVLGATAPAGSPAAPIDLTPAFDAFVARTGASVRDGEAACYIPSRDQIQMPARDRFRSTQGYCATLAHELVHWTGAKARLDRGLLTRSRDRSYAAEELVAELGSAFVMAQLGLAPEIWRAGSRSRDMAGWLPLLRSDRRAIFTAASLAVRSARFFEGAWLQPGRQHGNCARCPDTTGSATCENPSARPDLDTGAHIHSHGC